MTRLFLMLLLGISTCLQATLYHHRLDTTEKREAILLWQQDSVEPFDELFLSWNSSRPTVGQYTLSISLKTAEGWSPFMPYIEWCSVGQRSFHFSIDPPGVVVDQDTVTPPSQHTAEGFRIQIAAEGGATLEGLTALHVFARGLKPPRAPSENLQGSIELPVAPRSQYALESGEVTRLCSPTSTSAVVAYLRPDRTIDSVTFATNVWDGSHALYGNLSLIHI